MKSGVLGKVLILSIATCKVAVTSGFAGLSKPMWLSLIWTKVKSAPIAPSFFVLLANTRDRGTPPLRVHTRPVPAHAMHLRNPRRSTPSSLRSCNIWSTLSFSAISPPVLLPSQLITGKAFLYSNDLQQWRLLAKKGGLERGRLTAMGWLKMD